MSRAARLTSMPITVYSRRLGDPMTPQNVLPVVTPTRHTMSCFSSLPSSGIRSTTFWAKQTARRGSSGWTMGLRPNTIRKTRPLSSIVILLMDPCHVYIMSWTSSISICPAFHDGRACTSCDERGGASRLRPLICRNTIETWRISASVLGSWPASSSLWIALGM